MVWRVCVCNLIRISSNVHVYISTKNSKFVVFYCYDIDETEIFLAKGDHHHVPIWIELQETFENITKIYCMGSCTLNVVLNTSMFQS